LVERGAWKRCEVIEGSDVKAGALREFHGFGKTLFGVVIVSKNECAVDTNAIAAQVFECFGKSATHGVEGLIHLLEIRRIETLEPNQYTLASASAQQVQKVFVMSGVDAGLADPADL